MLRKTSYKYFGWIPLLLLSTVSTPAGVSELPPCDAGAAHPGGCLAQLQLFRGLPGLPCGDRDSLCRLYPPRQLGTQAIARVREPGAWGPCSASRARCGPYQRGGGLDIHVKRPRSTAAIAGSLWGEKRGKASVRGWQEQGNIPTRTGALPDNGLTWSRSRSRFRSRSRPWPPRPEPPRGSLASQGRQASPQQHGARRAQRSRPRPFRFVTARVGSGARLAEARCGLARYGQGRAAARAWEWRRPGYWWGEALAEDPGSPPRALAPDGRRWLSFPGRPRPEPLRWVPVLASVSLRVGSLPAPLPPRPGAAGKDGPAAEARSGAMCVARQRQHPGWGPETASTATTGALAGACWGKMRPSFPPCPSHLTGKETSLGASTTSSAARARSSELHGPVWLYKSVRQSSKSMWILSFLF